MITLKKNAHVLWQRVSQMFAASEEAGISFQAIDRHTQRRRPQAFALPYLPWPNCSAPAFIFPMPSTFFLPVPSFPLQPYPRPKQSFLLYSQLQSSTHFSWKCPSLPTQFSLLIPQVSPQPLFLSYSPSPWRFYFLSTNKHFHVILHDPYPSKQLPDTTKLLALDHTSHKANQHLFQTAWAATSSFLTFHKASWHLVSTLQLGKASEKSIRESLGFSKKPWR